MAAAFWRLLVGSVLPWRTIQVPRHLCKTPESPPNPVIGAISVIKIWELSLTAVSTYSTMKKIGAHLCREKTIPYS